jgi:prenyltransferase/squalene oxidase-like repeat protein
MIGRFLFLPFLIAFTTIVPVGGAERDRVDRAIDKALAYLKKTQESDGAWRGRTQKEPAITSLALMAFLSAGHVPGEGPYTDTVEKGIRWVLKAQDKNGLFAGDDGLDMYHHGISTLLLAEAAGMTDAKLGKEMKPALEKAVDVILKAQRHGADTSPQRGGWRYLARGTDADISVTGWQILALRAAKNLGCDVPAEKINLALDYVRRCQDPISGGFCYMPGGAVTVACTGTCILALELCGKDHRSREVLRGGGYLLKTPLDFKQQHFFYSVYYQSQAMFQLGSNYWNIFRPQLHKVLLGQQSANGSWNAGDGLGANYGTAMGILALTVEYRFLPIYQREEPQDERK